MKSQLLQLMTRLPLGSRVIGALRRARLTWMRCFPGIRPSTRFWSFLRLAYDARSARDLERTRFFLQKAEDTCPGNPRTAFLRGSLHHEQGQWNLAETDLLAVASHADTPPHERSAAHLHLAGIVASRGDLDAGHRHIAASLDRAQSESDAEAVAWSLLSEAVLNEHGRMDLAEECLRRHAEHAKAADPSEPQTILLSDDWVRNIGHLAMLDGQVKSKKLGLVPDVPIQLIAPSEKVANDAYLRHWREHLRIVDDPEQIRALAPLCAARGQRVSSFWRTGPNSTHYFMEAMAHVQSQWEARGLPPLLTLNEDCERRGHDFLRHAGIPEGAWFVGLHAREAGFHNEADTQRNRDVDIDSYRLAIEAVTRRGGWVVRIGDPRMTALPCLPRVIDYAHHPRRSPAIDVFLCARSRFFIGTASGLAHVPFTFGVPCVLTNWVSDAVIPPFAGHDLYIPKRMIERGSGRLLSWREQCVPAVRNLHLSYAMMRRAGLDVVNNTPEELRDVVEEMLDRLEGRTEHRVDDEDRQMQVKEIARSHGLADLPRMGGQFARCQPDFLSVLAIAPASQAA